LTNPLGPFRFCTKLGRRITGCSFLRNQKQTQSSGVKGLEHIHINISNDIFVKQVFSVNSLGLKVKKLKSKSHDKLCDLTPFPVVSITPDGSVVFTTLVHPWRNAVKPMDRKKRHCYP
jgi:hypothetical protein